MKRLVSILVIALAFIGGVIFAQVDEPQLPKGQLVPASGAIPLLDDARMTLLNYDFETEIAGLVSTPGWQLDATRAAGGHLAFAGGEGGYANDSQERLVLPLLALPALGPEVSGIRLVFQEWFELESEYDYGAVLVSADDGATWRELDRRSGQSDWRENTIDLTFYAGHNVLVAFDLVSDSSITYTGWQLDDIALVTSSRTALNVNIISLSSQNFPFVYLNVNVSRDGQPVMGLTSGNFFVTENGTQQTDYFSVTPPSEGGQVRLVDIVFCMDNSGSMSEEQNAVRNNVINFVNALQSQGASAAFGLVRFGQSANGGQPIVEEGGILTENPVYFRDTVWGRNIASGGTEPGLTAMCMAATGFAYRPGAQRIVILITDEDNDPGSCNQAQVLSLFQSSTTTAFCLIDHGFGTAHNDYCPVASATNGACLNVTDPFGPILDYIGTVATATYVVTYQSSDPYFNGVERHVVAQITDAEGSGSDDAIYTPGAAPRIERTPETIAYSDDNWAEGTPFQIDVIITDAIAPYVTSATLFYRSGLIPIVLPYSSIPMVHMAGDLWRTTIPGSAVHHYGLQYYISATDGQTTATDPSVMPGLFGYTIAILPNEHPELNHTALTEYLFGEDIDFECYATDETNELQSVVLYYRRVGLLQYIAQDMPGLVTHTGSINHTYANDNGIDYYIVATDNFGITSASGDADHPHTIWPFWEVKNPSGNEFLPSRDGWSFSNSDEGDVWPYNCAPFFCPDSERCHCGVLPWDKCFPTWEVMRLAFGSNQLEVSDGHGGVTRRPSAVNWWRTHKGCWPGSCYGFSRSATLFFDGRRAVPGTGSVHDLPANEDSRNIINPQHLYQFGRAQQNHRANHMNDPLSSFVSQLAAAMGASPPASTSLDFWANGGGHTVVPRSLHKVRADSFTVHIYDPNHPGQTKVLGVRTGSSGQWRYSPLGWSGTASLLQMPTSLDVGTPQMQTTGPIYRTDGLHDITGSAVYFSGQCDFVMSDPYGQINSYIDSSLVAEITESMPIVPTTGGFSAPIGFYVPLDQFRIRQEWFLDSTSHIIIRPSSLVSLAAMRRDAAYNQFDEFVADLPVKSLLVKNGDVEPKTYDLQGLTQDESTDERLLELRNLQLGGSDSIRIATDDSRFLVESFGMSSMYDLHLIAIINGTSQEFLRSGIELPSNSSLIIAPDWHNLIPPVEILIDSGRDGTIDDTLYVRNELGRDICNEDPEVTYTASALLQPRLVAKVEAGQLRLTWNAIPAASYYQIYRGDEFDNLTPVAMTYDTTWTDTTIAAVEASRKAFYQIVAQRTESFQLNNDEEDLLASWLFEEGTGEVSADETGHGHDAALHGTSWYEYDVDNHMCWAVGFANNQWADVANDAMFYMAPLQIDAHLKLDQLPTSSPSYILGNARYAPVNGGFAWRIEPNGILVALAWDGDGWNELRSVVPVVLGEWFTATLIINGDESLMLINGTVVAANRLVFTSHNNELPLTIGASALPNGAHQYFLRGQIGWMKMRELTLP